MPRKRTTIRNKYGQLPTPEETMYEAEQRAKAEEEERLAQERYNAASLETCIHEREKTEVQRQVDMLTERDRILSPTFRKQLRAQYDKPWWIELHDRITG